MLLGDRNQARLRRRRRRQKTVSMGRFDRSISYDKLSALCFVAMVRRVPEPRSLSSSSAIAVVRLVARSLSEHSRSMTMNRKTRSNGRGASEERASETFPRATSRGIRACVCRGREPCRGVSCAKAGRAVRPRHVQGPMFDNSSSNRSRSNGLRITARTLRFGTCTRDSFIAVKSMTGTSIPSRSSSRRKSRPFIRGIR